MEVSGVTKPAHVRYGAIEVRDLKPGDLDALSEFIIQIYAEYPTAMWFESRPTSSDIRMLFKYKLMGMADGKVVDIVAVSDGAILGECEIAEITNDTGYLGVIVKKEAQREGIATMLMECAYGQARHIGLKRIIAEVVAENDGARRLFSKNNYALAAGEERLVSIGGKEHELLVFEKRL